MGGIHIGSQIVKENKKMSLELYLLYLRILRDNWDVIGFGENSIGWFVGLRITGSPEGHSRYYICRN